MSFGVLVAVIVLALAVYELVRVRQTINGLTRELLRHWDKKEEQRPTLQRWEHLSVTPVLLKNYEMLYSVGGGSSETAESLTEAMGGRDPDRLLDYLGGAGWELVSVCVLENKEASRFEFTYYLKRPRQ